MTDSDTFESLLPLAARVAARLMARGERIAVADGASGGLISAALLAVPGASAFHSGGGIVYSRRARDVLMALDRAALKGMRSVTESYALLQARAIRDNFGADWGVAESGAAGGSIHPAGAGSGESWAAVAGPGGEWARFTQTLADGRPANMVAFARAALELLEDSLG